MCAALDRQHPRDLFDVGFLLKSGIGVDLKNAFLIYLISNNRPMHELLMPNLIDIKSSYENEFVGMANVETKLEQLLDNRINLIAKLNTIFDDKNKEFLISVKKGEPDFSLYPVAGVENMPSIKWKLHNIEKMDKDKQVVQLKKLEQALR